MKPVSYFIFCLSLLFALPSFAAQGRQVNSEFVQGNKKIKKQKVSAHSFEKKPKQIYLPKVVLFLGSLSVILLGAILIGVLSLVGSAAIGWIIATIGLLGLIAWVVLYFVDYR